MKSSVLENLYFNTNKIQLIVYSKWQKDQNKYFLNREALKIFKLLTMFKMLSMKVLRGNWSMVSCLVKFFL